MECGMVGWSASRLAGWLAGCLAASVENRPTPIHSSSLSSYVRVSLFIYICVKLVFGKCVCALRRKKKEGWRRVARSRVEERRWFPQRRNFSTRAPKWPSRGMGREILVSLSPFFFLVTFRFLWSRERNFNCAVVCLVMRIRAPFFHLVSTGNCWCRGGRNLVEVSGPSRVRVCTAKRKFSPPICSPFVRALIPRCLLYRRRLFLAREGFVSLSVHTGRKWTSGSFLATMCIPQLDIYYTRVYSRLLV